VQVSDRQNRRRPVPVHAGCGRTVRPLTGLTPPKQSPDRVTPGHQQRPTDPPGVGRLRTLGPCRPSSSSRRRRRSPAGRTTHGPNSA
jgi:hypothetical protein